MEECTKKAIKIRYCNKNQDEMTIRKAKLEEIKFYGKSIYYFKQCEEIIGKGKNQIIDVLKGLNYSYTDYEEDSFFYIKTRIKLFDELKLSNDLKSIIYLIDFPGYSTNNIFVKCQKSYL